MKKVDFIIEGKRYNFDWLTMNDFMGLYSKKHNWEKIYEAHGEEEARKYLYGFIDDAYPEIPEKYRMMVFISLVIASEGRGDIILTNECSKCQEEHNISLRLNNLNTEKSTKFFDVDGNDIEIVFNAINYRNKENLITNLYDGISIVKINGNIIEWDLLADDTKMSILSYIGDKEIKDLINSLIPCSVTFHSAYGCDDIQELNGFIEFDDMKIFDWLINKTEVNTVYKIATIMASNGIGMADYMNMAPFERKEILKNIKENNESDRRE